MAAAKMPPESEADAQVNGDAVIRETFWAKDRFFISDTEVHVGGGGGVRRVRKPPPTVIWVVAPGRGAAELITS